MTHLNLFVDSLVHFVPKSSSFYVLFVILAAEIPAKMSSSSSKTSSEVDAFRHLTDAEIREFREIFSLVDKDGGGTIDAEEVRV